MHKFNKKFRKTQNFFVFYAKWQATFLKDCSPIIAIFVFYQINFNRVSSLSIYAVAIARMRSCPKLNLS